MAREELESETIIGVTHEAHPPLRSLIQSAIDGGERTAEIDARPHGRLHFAASVALGLCLRQRLSNIPSNGERGSLQLDIAFG